MAAPGVPLLVVEDPSSFRLEAQVDEGKIGAVKLGESVPVVIDSLGDNPITGKVIQIVPAADPSSRTFTVKIDLPTLSSARVDDRGGTPAQIRSGLFGRVSFPLGQREAIAIPKSAVLSRGQMQAVYVIGGDQLAGLRFVTLGAVSGDQVEVLSGLQNGDRIVTQPGDRELSGKQIEAQ